MHRIHVRTGFVEVPGVEPGDERPTHDQFIIPTGDNEEVVELEVFDLGPVYRENPAAKFNPRVPANLKSNRWRFRAVSVERISEASIDSDIVIEVDQEQGIVSEETVRRLLGPAGGA
jgi:hypothetical protein